MKIRTNYVSNSSSSSFVIHCENKEHLEYIRKIVNNYLDAMNKINSLVEEFYTTNADGKSIELNTMDGDYICQNAVRNLQNFIQTYGLTDKNGDAIEFEAKEIYKG